LREHNAAKIRHGKASHVLSDSINAERNASQVLTSLRVLVAEQFTDLVIQVGTRVWRVHRAIMSARSAFFEAACAGSFKEGKEGHVHLQDDDPDAVEAMILYCYTGVYTRASSAPLCAVNAESGPEDHGLDAISPDIYPETQRNSTAWCRSCFHPLNVGAGGALAILPLHAHVGVLADKYVMKELGALAEIAFRIAILKHSRAPLTAYFHEAVRTIFSVPDLVCLRLKSMAVDAIASCDETFDQQRGMADLLGEVCELDPAVLVRYRTLRHESESCLRNSAVTHQGSGFGN